MGKYIVKTCVVGNCIHFDRQRDYIFCNEYNSRWPIQQRKSDERRGTESFGGEV